MISPVELVLGHTTDEYQVIHIILHSPAIAPTALETLQLPPATRWDRGIILNGRAPIWVYAALVHLCHPARWIATVDPRMSGAVVVERHHPDAPAIGALVSLPPEYLKPPVSEAPPSLPTEKHSSIAVAIVGPPHSGKSVLAAWILRTLAQRLRVESFNQDVFLLRACPDGEGNWSGETPPQNVRLLRYKQRFDPAFVQHVESSITELRKTKKLLLVDTGGKIDRWSQRILNHCTHGIIVSAKRTEFCRWRGALAASDIEIIAEIESVRSPAQDVVREHPLRLRIGNLERGRLDSIPETLLTALLHKANLL